MGHSLTECSEADGRGDLVRELTLRATGIKGAPARGLCGGEGAEAIGDTRMEGGVKPLLEARAAIARLAGEPLLCGKVQEHGEVWSQTCSGKGNHCTQLVERESTPVSLVRKCGVGEAIGDDGGATRQCGADHFSDKLRTGGVEEEGVSTWVDLHTATLAEEECADALSGRCAARLSHGEHLTTCGTEPLSQEGNLGGLPRSVWPLKGDEHRGLATTSRGARRATLGFKSNASMWITATGTTSDTRVSSELVLKPTNVGVLWRKLNRVLCASHLFDPRLCLAHRDLAWVVRQLIDVEQCALHLLGGVALEHMHRNSASLGIHNRRATLLELIADRYNSIGLIGCSRCSCWEPELTNHRLELLARDSVREDSQLWELADFALIIIGARRLIPLCWNQCTAHRSSDRLVIHLGDSCRH